MAEVKWYHPDGDGFKDFMFAVCDNGMFFLTMNEQI